MIKTLPAVAALLVSGLLSACVVEQPGDASARGGNEQLSPAAGPSAEAGSESKKPDATDGAGSKRKREREPSPESKPDRDPKTYLVTRIVDGDTIELGNGETIRVVGIDTPERGQCGYDAATTAMANLVLGKRVRLTTFDEDTDRYGRWLRYVNIGAVDAGLRQITNGFAIARYDSRDGYGFHPRENTYVAADKQSKNVGCPKPTPTPTPSNPGACAAGYSPCIPPYPPDVNCDDVNGSIRVTGSDPHGLDADGDGVACE